MTSNSKYDAYEAHKRANPSPVPVWVDKTFALIGQTFVVLLCLGLAAIAGLGAYWVWPSGITDVPLSALTLGLIGRVVVGVTLGLVALGLLGGAYAAVVEAAVKLQFIDERRNR